ncbi:serine/threonine-protein kinase [Streptomyces sp. TRM64462]|uniref:serine/threonine-protein kinase n=1 Tax=Streptomyces sp. TRM64462 TaxID=2741726 RepID=UPI001586B611|nr:serine/threonine-protein kinase [Streptomyces sp. TRM64462]
MLTHGLDGPSHRGPSHIGPFRTVAALGRGGMGEVLLAVGTDGRLVAVKRVHADLAEDPGFRSRFRREVDASRRVSGAYTAPVIDADPDASTPWLASLFLPAPSLSDALDAAGTLPEDAVRQLAVGLARALEEIHRADLVHRDLKPSNVLLTEDGVRVVDFGIARAADHETKLTHTGALIGSPAFMSPEQVRGEPPGPPSDVFSLGVTLVTAATGRAPYAGESPLALMHAVAHDEPDLSALPPGLLPIVAPCLAKDPGARPTPAQLLDLIGPLDPTSRPWPDAVHQRIAQLQDWATGQAAAAVPPPQARTQAVPTPPSPPFPPNLSAAAPRRRRALKAAALVTGSLVALATVPLLIYGPSAVYHEFFPVPTPTPGGTPLAQVPDKYTGGKVPTCEQANRTMKAPDGFGEASGNPNTGTRQDLDGQRFASNFCVWNTRSGDEIYIGWNLYPSIPGGPTGAERSKERFEGLFHTADGKGRDLDLGFVQEGFWHQNPDDSNCILYARDVNLNLFVSIKGTRYPKGTCQDITKNMARQARTAVTSL